MIIIRIRKTWIKWIVGISACALVLFCLWLDQVINSDSKWPLQKRDVTVCDTGAWGKLWYERSAIEIPPNRIQVVSFEPKATEWYVTNTSPAQIEGTLQTCGLESRQIQELLSTMTPAADGAGRVLHPSENLLLSLSDPTRRELYGMLGHFAQNSACTWPFRFSGDPSSDWFKGSDIDPKVVDLVRSLIYHEGKSQMFADLDYVLERFPSVTVYSNLFRTLSRESTLVARVRVTSGDDVDTLAHYWGRPNRETEVRTLMKTQQGTDNCRDVPVSMLLPGFARDRIYRYWHEGDPEFPSCHYTAMNFLNEKADGRFTNLTEVANTLAKDYVEVESDFRLGDVILLMQNEKEAIHSCNYVAGGIVFTRNGGNIAQPWMLTTLDSVVDFYSYPDPVHIKVMRRRDLAGLSTTSLTFSQAR